jgi:hypothetical protein
MADESIKRLIELGINATPALKELDKLGQETAKQTKSIQGMSTQLNNFARSFVTGLSVGVITSFASQAVDAFRSMIDELDALDEKSQNLGISVERFQTLSSVFELSGVKGEKLETGLARLAETMADLDSPTNNAARLLREVGVAAGDDAYEAMLKIADVFANAPDGIDKTAYAIEVFGKKVGPQMVAALNAGRGGIQSTEEEMKKLGISSAETAKQAGEFNDNMDKLNKMAKSVGLSITEFLLPSLVDVSANLLRNVKDGTVWLDFWQKYKKWVGDFWSGDKTSAAELTALQAQRAWEDAGQAAIDAQNAIVQAGKAGEVPKTAKPATTPKAKAGGRSAKEQESEWEKWIGSLKKLEDQTDITDQKINYLEATLNDLEAAGLANTQWTEALRKELDRLRPDPVAAAMQKISDAAKEIDVNTPRMIMALQLQLDALEVAGKGATTQAKLLREELLKLEAVKDPVAAVELELQKMGETAEKNAKLEAEWFKALASGKASSAEFAKGLTPLLTDLQQGFKDTTDETNKLADSIVEMGGKFVTDFIDQMIDGMGKADQSFADMVESMIKQIAKLIIQMEVAQLVKALLGGGGMGGLGGFAQGAAWNASGLEFMARGGVLNQPMLFANGGRLAVAGEAGPEGVVPLRRGANGDLGVAASPTIINITNNTPSTVSTSESTNSDGTKVIDVLIAQKVKTLLTNGSMDRTMRSAYGLSRQPVVG